MNSPSIDDTSLLIPRSGIPASVRDTRRPYEKKLAIYLILASTLFERIAFYSLVGNLVVTLQSSELLDWNSRHSLTALFLFSGHRNDRSFTSIARFIVGTSYISTLIFAGISDAKAGRAKTITFGKYQSVSIVFDLHDEF